MSLNSDAPLSSVATRTIKAVVICENQILRSGILQLVEGSSFSIESIEEDQASFLRKELLPPPELVIVVGAKLSDATASAGSILKEKYPKTRVALIADNFDLEFLQLAYRRGVDGFCLAHQEREVLIKSLELVALGEIVVPSTIADILLKAAEANPSKGVGDPQVLPESSLDKPGARQLSSREVEILKHLMEGAANKVIARKLNVAEATVKVHIKAILRKIGAANRTQAAMWASAQYQNKAGSSH